MSRGGRWERMAVRLNAILRKLPKNASLDGKQWHAETHARRSLMRYLVGIVGRLIEEEEEREHDRHLAEQRIPEEVGEGRAPILLDGVTIGGKPLDLSDLKPGDTLDIRLAPQETKTIPVVRSFGPVDVGASTQGPEVGACGWCGKILPTSGECPCIPF